MGKLIVSYPFDNSDYLVPGGVNSNSSLLSDYVKGSNAIGAKYGTYSAGSDSIYVSGSGYYRCYYATFTPRFFTPVFRWEIPTKPQTTKSLYSRIYNGDYYNNLYKDDTITNKDYTTIPFYSYETESTYMFAIGNLINFFLLTERFLIDDPSVKSCAMFARKSASGNNPSNGGVDLPSGNIIYEWNDAAKISIPTDAANIYTPDTLYNASNVGYCSTYSLYQYTRDGYIYPDIYYCDGGLSVPPDGIVRIGTSKFMRLGSNIFLRID